MVFDSHYLHNHSTPRRPLIFKIINSNCTGSSQLVLFWLLTLYHCLIGILLIAYGDYSLLYNQIYSQQTHFCSYFWPPSSPILPHVLEFCSLILLVFLFAGQEILTLPTKIFWVSDRDEFFSFVHEIWLELYMSITVYHNEFWGLSHRTHGSRVQLSVFV